MMMLQMLAQLILPLLLLIWLALYPANQPFLYAIQLVCTGLLLADIALVGIWLIIPWWTPYAYGLLFLLAVLLNYVRRDRRVRPQRHVGWIDKALISAVAVFSIFGTYYGISAQIGQYPQDERMVDIQPPLSEGTYLVAQGGSNGTVNGHYMTLDTSLPQFASWRGQSKALDVVKINTFGFRAGGLLPEDPRRYYSFGVEVIAPCDGQITAAVDGVDDMPVPQMDRAHMLGNHVIVDCGEFYTVLAHLKNGSIAVRMADVVEVGTRLGELGNSGNSTEPHLHIHAQATLPQVEPISGEPLTLTIKGVFHARNDRMIVQ